MKQTLQLKLGQHLTMTPQLQQAIRLLQLSSLDLQQEIQEALESNMMLEADDNETAPAEKDQNSEENPNTQATEKNPDNITSEGSQTEMPEELPVDTTWDDVYDNVSPTLSGSQEDFFEPQRSAATTLHDHLIWQMELAHFSEQDRAIATAIIDAINVDGLLGMSVDEIHSGLIEQIEELDLDEVVAVLHQIQNFDPAGIAGTDLADCLRIQLNQLPDDTKWKGTAIELVTQYLDCLASQNQSRLKRMLDVSDEELNEVIALIRTLDPRPGTRIETTASEYVIPDVFVSKKNGIWRVTLNPDIAPKLRVNPFYSGLVKSADNSADNTTMKNHLQEARWFLKSLQSRSETLLKVAKCIVEHQQGFLDHGDIAMKPLVLREIAEAVEMHESTISRVTTQKYMHTPNGIYEFKFFFSSHVSTTTGGACSSTAIRAFIKELVDHESPAKPLSDSKISILLKEKGINVARRTVAKYRENLSILPSHERKRVI